MDWTSIDTQGAVSAIAYFAIILVVYLSTKPLIKSLMLGPEDESQDEN